MRQPSIADPALAQPHRWARGVVRAVATIATWLAALWLAAAP
jgi:hypothetical protein